MKNKYLFLLILLSVQYFSFAQEWLEQDNLRQKHLENAQYDSAAIFAINVKNIIEKEFGTKDTLYGQALNNEGFIYLSTGEYEKAEPLFEKAVKCFEDNKTENAKAYSFALSNIGTLYNWTSRYEKAENVFLKVLEIRKKTGEKTPEYATALNNLGNIYKDVGRYKESEEYYLKAIELRKELFGEKDSEYGVAINNLAILYVNMGQYDKGAEILLKARDIFKEIPGEGQVKYLTVTNNLGAIYWSMGDFIKAEPMLVDVEIKLKEIVGEEHPNHITAINNLAVLYSHINKLDLAIEYNLKALALREKTMGKTNYDYSISLNNLGANYLDFSFVCDTPSCKTKAIQMSRDYYLEAEQIRFKLFGPKHPDYDLILKNLANTYLYEDDLAGAEKIYLKSMDILNYNIQENFSFLSEKEKEQFFKMKYGDIKSFYSFSYKYKDQKPEISTHVYDNVLKNKGLLLKSSTAMRTAIASSNDTSLVNAFDKWIDLKKKIAKQYSIAVDKRDTDPVLLEEEANLLEKELVKKSSIISDFDKNKNVTWKEIRKSLKPGEAAIEFIHFNFYDKRWTDSILYLALIVKSDSKYPEMITLFEEKTLTGILKEFDGNNLKYVNGLYGTNSDLKDDLYNIIWKPMENALKGISTVYLSPTGLLHKISFASLNSSKNVLLCDVIDIRTQSSTAKVAVPEIFSFEKNMTASIFGGIDYSGETGETVWQYLEGTKTESEKIHSFLKEKNIKVSMLSEKNATESEFKKMAANNNLLHIATHGFFYPDPKNVNKTDSLTQETGSVIFRGGERGAGVENFVKNENPLMRSGLVFAGANEVWSEKKISNLDDGVLTAQEVSNINMGKTGLVVLSACETGLGDISVNDGVYGLQRAFKIAGTKFIVMSLWQVPDKETEEFMISFYSNFFKLKNIREAFSETQKEMRKKYDPYFWGAFVLIE
ncbi:MAG: hypothetical protein A2W91_04235 [Bacteroidetes bacterium GWF2_38_335]|nr:MAG: hypothetical protein A2W91_04235 [Bacteroidetes bacterium GWF2_38_335]HBS88754.1 hypothetical protein [Bacteroidales bacterium]